MEKCCLNFNFRLWCHKCYKFMWFTLCRVTNWRDDFWRCQDEAKKFQSCFKGKTQQLKWSGLRLVCRHSTLKSYFMESTGFVFTHVKGTNASFLWFCGSNKKNCAKRNPKLIHKKSAQIYNRPLSRLFVLYIELWFRLASSPRQH